MKTKRFKVDLNRLEELEIDEDVKKLVLDDIKKEIEDKQYYYSIRCNDMILEQITIEHNFNMIDYCVFFNIKNIHNEQTGKLRYYQYEIRAIRISKVKRNSIYEDYEVTDLFNNIPRL